MAKAERRQCDGILNSVGHDQKRSDCFEILKMMKRSPKRSRRCGVRASSALAVITTTEKRARRRLDVDRFLASQAEPDILLMGGFDTHFPKYRKRAIAMPLLTPPN